MQKVWLRAAVLVYYFSVYFVAALSVRNIQNSTKFGDDCILIQRLQIESAEEEIDIESLSDRGYPLLKCTFYNKTLLQGFQFNDAVNGFLLNGNRDKAFSLEDLDLFPTLKTVEFHQVSQITTPPPNSSFSLPNITSLSLIKCNRTVVPTPLFSFFPNLLRLTLSQNNISAVRLGDFDSASSLKSIDLGHNPITSLNTSWLDTASNLERLTLRGINLKDVGILFRTARYLKFLDLSDNKLTSLITKPFRLAPSLTTLILANNKISEISKQAFKGPKNLRLIDLTENAIKTLPEGVFSFQASHELTVEMWENPFNCNCSMKWLKQWIDGEQSYGSYPDVRLKCHNPARNHGKKFMAPNGTTISTEDLACKESDKEWTGAESCAEQAPTNPSSTNITASTTTSPSTTTAPRSLEPQKPCPKACQCYKAIQDLPPKFNPRTTDFAFPLVMCTWNHLDATPSVPDDTQGLVMTFTNLEVLDVGKLHLPAKLKNLVLKHNFISRLVSNKDIVFKQVEILVLENNQITEITPDFLSSFPSLTKLSLFNNNITQIDSKLFENNLQLKKLLLGPNPISGKFNGNKALAKLHKLTKLQLRGLNIVKVPPALKNKFYLQSVDLSDNMITRIRNDSFENCTKLSTISLENNNISVIDSRAFSSLSNLVHLDLSENALESIPGNLLSHSGDEISHVELWQNPIWCDCNLKPFVALVKNLERNNPATEIRFRCEFPLRMRGKTSDETNEDDYFCSKNDKTADSKDSAGADKIYTQKDLSVAIGLSVFFCVIFFIVIQIVWCRCLRSRRYKGLSNYRFSSLSGNGQTPIINDENDMAGL